MKLATNQALVKDCEMQLLDSSVPYIIKVRDVLTASECSELIARIDAEGPAVAPINTVYGPQVRIDIRNNERVMFDDVELARLLYERALPKAPPKIHDWQLIGANERIRCYRYRRGMRFAPHYDFAFERSSVEQSFLSYLVYLNDDFEGGNTTFITDPAVAIRPEPGMGLLFQHPILHEGSEVTAGTKYVVRTDLMYRRGQ